MIIFARTRHTYDSYGDFWRLVVAAGFDTCYVDEIDLASDNTYVFTPINGEVMPRLAAWKDRRCKIVWWNLERPEDETLPRSLAAVRGAVDAVWVSDRIYAAKHEALTYVQLAGYPGFGQPSSERCYDVCHLSYVHGRRTPIVNSLLQRGMRIAPEAYGQAAQDRFVAQSHLMLNTHQYYGMWVVAPLRFAVAACYAIPIVSEPFTDPIANELVIHQAPWSRLADVIARLLTDLDRLHEQGFRLHQRLCVDTDFRREVESGI